jgi:hypothetical protein
MAFSMERLITKSTNSAISGATVQLYGPNSSTLKDTKTTDSNGNFSFSNLQQGDYYLYITKSGYYEKFTNFYTITNSSYNAGNIYLTPSVSVPVTRTLTVASSNPISGVYIYASPNDNNGQADGATQFTRIFDNGTQVTLLALTTANGNNFSGWSGCNSTSGPSGSFCFVTMDANKTVMAAYTTNSYTVTPSAGMGGSISPSTPQTVNYNTTLQFTVTPNTGYHITSIGGTCGGILSGNIFTTNAITSNCTVIANFAMDSPTTYLVTPSVVGSGNISPSTAVTVNAGSTPQFTVYPYSPNYIEGITGTCGGSLAGNTFTTNTITSNCTVIANFAACSYSINPSSQSFTSSGGSDAVSVTAHSGCGWGAYSNVYWITVTSGSNGSGDGTVYYSVATNMSPSSRIGTLNIGGQIFTVTQAGYSETINPPTNLQAIANSDNTITLTWNDNSSNEEAFLIERRIGTGSYYGINALDSNTTSWVDNGFSSGLTPGTTYCYRVRAFSSAFGYSAYSNESCATLYSGVLSVTPTGGFSFSGNEGGQFTPTTNTLTIQNTGNSPFDWTASSNVNWISLNPTAGNLAAGGIATIAVSINSNANKLTSGVYDDTITISANGAVNSPQTRSVSLSIAPKGTGWNIETIDSAGYVGRSSHLAIDSNNKIHISYADDGPKGFYTHLKYATNTSGAWVTTTLASEDGNGYYIGYFNDIAIDKNGKIHISYSYYNNPSNTGYLKYVTNASGTWGTSIIDNSEAAGSFNSIAIDSNNKVHISYVASGNLKYATNVTGSWVISTIDNGGYTRYTSIAIDSNDKMHISYFDANPTNQALKYATNVSGSWDIYTIESNLAENVSNAYTSLAVDNNGKVHITYPHASYNQIWTHELKYATNALGSWDISTIIDSNQSGNIYYYSSIAVDSNNKVHISYSDYTNHNLKYATNLSGSWVTSIVDSLAGGGGYSSIATDSNNKVHISYYDDINFDLKYAKQTDNIPPTGQISINSNSAFTNIASVTLTLSASDPNGVPQMCISNTATCSSGSWEAYTTSKAWTLPSGDGEKTVYVWFKDSAGNLNETPYSDMIILDTTAPSNGTLSATAGNAQVLLNWTGFNDALSGINNYKVVYSTGDTPSSCLSGMQIYTGTDTTYTNIPLTNGVTYNYRVCAIDNAGNISTGATRSATPQISIETNCFDGIDNDNDGLIDCADSDCASACLQVSYYCDNDSDGYINSSIDGTCTGVNCQPLGCQTSLGTDCNDNDPKEHPNQTWYKDADNDGYSDGTINTTSCIRPSGYKIASELTAISGDCNDSDASIHPGATEVCNGKDDNCDGQTDEDVCFTMLYVEKSGVCGGNSPCYSSMQDGINAAGNEATIKVAQGTYHENILINTSKDFTLLGGWDSNFSSKTDAPSQTIINGDATNDGVGDGSAIALNAGSGVNITVNVENLTITNGYATKGGGINIVSSNSGSAQVTLQNNFITGNTAEYGGGIYTESSNSGTTALTLTNNMIVENTATYGGGIYVNSMDSGSITNLTLTNNTTTDNAADYGAGIYAESSNSGFTTMTAKNDIIWGNTEDDIYLYQNNSTTSISTSYSDICGVVKDAIHPGSYTGDTTNLNADPIFINPAMSNYHLNSDSPCRDAGTSTGAPTIDIEGDTRPQDSGYDIGADESVYTPFTSIKLLSLNGSEIIPSGSTYNITWAAPSDAEKFKLLYSVNNGLTWKLIASDVTGTSYDWGVQTPRNNKKGCFIKVVGYNSGGVKVGAVKSNEPFTIEVVKLTSPDGGETLTAGSTHTIEWTTNATVNSVASVKLLYTLNGTTWKKIPEAITGNPGSYLWTVPTVKKEKTKCKVKVILKDSTGNKAGVDVSDNYFTIQP